MRRLIARSWGCKPSEVGEESNEEVEIELRIMAVEARCQPRQRTVKRKGR